MTVKSVKDTSISLPKALTGVVLAVLAILYISWLCFHNLEEPGIFGDMFGVANALFSGVAFGGVIIAILLQKEELRLQRKELKYTRDELRGQKEQLAAQNDTLRKQNFENTFFQLVRFQNEITGSLGIPRPESNSFEIAIEGRRCFEVLYDELKKIWVFVRDEHHNVTQSELIGIAYNEFLKSYHPIIGHYFRGLYNILKFVDNSDMEDKRLYTNLIRAQLSSNELLLIFYDGLGFMDSEKFRILIEKYSILKSLRKNDLIDPGAHRDLYDHSAYGIYSQPTDK